MQNGAIPYFHDLEFAPRHCLTVFPIDLVEEAMRLPGVHFNESIGTGWIDHTVFDQKRYFEIAHELFAYTKANLTTGAMASRVLSRMSTASGAPVRAESSISIRTLAPPGANSASCASSHVD